MPENLDNDLTYKEIMEIEIIAYIAMCGEKCDVYDLLKQIEDFDTKPQFYATELRIMLRKMELAGLIDIMTGNNSQKDAYGFRPIAQINLKV